MKYRKDAIGQPIEVGDYVVFYRSGKLRFGKVFKISDKGSVCIVDAITEHKVFNPRSHSEKIIKIPDVGSEDLEIMCSFNKL